MRPYHAARQTGDGTGTRDGGRGEGGSGRGGAGRGPTGTVQLPGHHGQGGARSGAALAARRAALARGLRVLPGYWELVGVPVGWALNRVKGVDMGGAASLMRDRISGSVRACATLLVINYVDTD